MTASDPGTRLSIWRTIRSPGIPRVELLVLVAPAMQALAVETDSRVQLELVTILGVSAADPGVRAALESVAGSDRQEPVRMAAQRVLHGDAGWNKYFVARLEDPQVPDTERLELMRYVYSATGTLSGLGEAVIRLDEAAASSLGRLVKTPGSRDVGALAAQLLERAGDASLVREVFIDFLRSSAGQPLADEELRRSVLASLTMGTRLAGLALHQDVRPVVEQISARDPDPEMREVARQVLQQADQR